MFDSKVLQVQVSPILYSLVAWLTSHSPFPYINHYIPYMNWNFCIQIPRERVDFNGDSAVKSPCWFWVLNLQLFNPDLLPFAPIVSYLIWPFFMAPHCWVHSSGQYSAEPLGSSCNQALRNTVQTFPEPVCPERAFRSSVWITMESSFVFFYQQYMEFPSGTHPSPIQAQFYLSSVLFPTWHGLLTRAPYF